MAEPKTKKPRLTAAEREEKRQQEDAANTFSHYWCLLCEGEEAPFFESGQALGAHCREHHPETVTTEGKVGGKRRTSAHLDADRWYEWQYVYSTTEGKDFAQQTVRGPRRRGGYWDA